MSGPEILREPTGDLIADRERELDGADYAVQFWQDRYFTINLHSKDTDAHGELWALGAYGNMKIYALNGSAEEIYLLTERDLGKAYNMARFRIKEKQDSVKILREEIGKIALRVIDKEYLAAQQEARRQQHDDKGKQDSD